MLEIILVVVGLVGGVWFLYDIFKLNYNHNRCPRCKTGFFSNVLKSSENLGPDFSNPTYDLIRSYYQCERCKHEWSKDGYQKRGGSVD